MDIQKLKAIRTGQKRGAVTKILRKMKDGCDDARLEELMETVTNKREILKQLDKQILEALNDGDIGTESEDADEYQSQIERTSQ